MEHAPRNKGFPTDPKEYKLYEEIGEGVSATVFRALCVPLNTFVAIKVLDLEKCSSDLVSSLQFIVTHKTFRSIMFHDLALSITLFRINLLFVITTSLRRT
jgi:serine/threonine protein kinase